MTTDTKYTVDLEKKNLFASVYLLDYLVNKVGGIDPDDSENINLRPIVAWMTIKELIEMGDGGKHVASEKGRTFLKTFMKRYIDFLQVFDVFCAVDLGEGGFAFSSYFDMESTEDWQKLLHDEKLQHAEDFDKAFALYVWRFRLETELDDITKAENKFSANSREGSSNLGGYTDRKDYDEKVKKLNKKIDEISNYLERFFDSGSIEVLNVENQLSNDNEANRDKFSCGSKAIHKVIDRAFYHIYSPNKKPTPVEVL